MNMIRHGPAPSDLAASMYSFSLSERVWPRTILEMPAQAKNEMTPMTIEQARSEHRGQGERQHDEGEGQHGVDEPGQDRVDYAAEVPGDQADGDAGDGADRGGEEPDKERDPRSVEDPDEQVAANVVGAEPEAIRARPDRAPPLLPRVRERLVDAVAGERGEQPARRWPDDHDRG